MASTSVLAAQMFTLREFTTTPADIAATCRRVRKIGYEAIQVSAFGPIEPTELARILTGEGLTCCATHVSFDRMRQESRKVIDEHRTLSCAQTAVGILPASYRGRGSVGYLEFARDASEIARTFRHAGISWSYHNHAFELERLTDDSAGRRGLDIILSESDAAAVNMEIDTYWIQFGGGDPAEWIRRCKGRIPLLHLKDMAVAGEKPVMAEVGEGNMHWPAILAAAREAGVMWYIIEQDECRRDPFDSLAISLRNVREMGLA